VSINFNWTCPHCWHSQIATEQNREAHDWAPYVGKTNLGNVGTRSDITACLNAECQKITLGLSLLRSTQDSVGDYRLFGKPLESWRLIPESSARVQPDYIPEPLRTDYYEACRIRELSPKASATLARRCLQGMIRDFCKIAKGTLDEEIRTLKAEVDADQAPCGVTPESVDAIDHVRRIGNIGAHMEKNIDLIVEIDPDEAQILLELVETLFDEWYVAKKIREERFASLAALRSAKDAEKKSGSP
jgi:hypothetical protein